MPEELVPREELRATLEARRELGPAYDDQLVERFAERLEGRLRRPARREAPLSGEQAGIVIVSILAAIPLIAIAGSAAGLAGILAVCAALVAVNFLVLRR